MYVTGRFFRSDDNQSAAKFNVPLPEISVMSLLGSELSGMPSLSKSVLELSSAVDISKRTVIDPSLLRVTSGKMASELFVTWRFF